MRQKVTLLGVGLLLVFTLSACWEKKPSYLYLMVHPDYLQRVYNQCVAEVAESSLPCSIIMRAQADFTSLIYQHEQDPERFGSQILQAEENSVFFKKKLDAALQNYQALDKTYAPLEEVKKMRIDLDQIQETYTISAERIKVLLVVISVTSYL